MTTVEHGENDRGGAFEAVINRKGEALGQAAMQARQGFWVNARIQRERIDVRKKTIEKILAKPRGLTFVELETRQQIPFG